MSYSDSNSNSGDNDYMFLIEHELFDTIEDDTTLVYVQKLIPLAKRGDNNAIYEIGEEYSRHQLYSKAMDWYQFAADRNYPAAMYEIGSLYQHGRGVSVNYFRSLEWLLKAAKGNYTDSFYNIGLQFESGWGVSEDKNRAMEWFYKYAEDSTNLENLINEGHPFADDQKEKDVKNMAFEAEIILKIEELQHDKKQLNNELALMRETCHEMKRNIDLINGRVTLLRDENKVLWNELEKGKTETASKVDGLERHVDQLVELLIKHNISA